jgi:hypothetical protein
VLQAATKQRLRPDAADPRGTARGLEGLRREREPDDFDIVWVHKNIMRRQGEDFCWYTLGVEHLLSRKPVPLEKDVPTRRAALRDGLRDHRDAQDLSRRLPDLGREVQKEINETSTSARTT